MHSPSGRIKNQTGLYRILQAFDCRAEVFLPLALEGIEECQGILFRRKGYHRILWHHTLDIFKERSCIDEGFRALTPLQLSKKSQVVAGDGKIILSSSLQEAPYRIVHLSAKERVFFYV